MSTRTFQRQLANEDTSFSRILDEVKREVALEWLEMDAGKLEELAYSLGYAHPPALTRAVQRWLGKPPTEQRRKKKRS